MSHLTYPSEEFSDRVEAIRDALASEAAVLSAVADRAAEQAQQLHGVLEEQTPRLGEASDVAGLQAGRYSREKVIILFN